MKKILVWSAAIWMGVAIVGCGSSKKAHKSPIATYVMPCSEYVSGDGVLRAWAIGKSDNEATARKKAQAMASAELAAMLAKTVATTTEDYTTALSEGLVAASKSLLSEKSKQTVEKTLSGATIVCDRWNKDEQSGQYTNYIVMELKGDEYLKNLYEELGKNSSVSIDQTLLRKLFFKNIEESGEK